MKKPFTGTSPNGHLIEAIRDALNKAATEFNKDTVWTLKEAGGTRLELGSISATIEIDTDKKGGGPDDLKPH